MTMRTKLCGKLAISTLHEAQDILLYKTFSLTGQSDTRT